MKETIGMSMWKGSSERLKTGVTQTYFYIQGGVGKQRGFSVALYD